MADNRLIFPVGFDLDSAIKKAETEWASKYHAQLDKAIRNKPLSVNVDISVKNLDNLESVKKRLAEIKLAPVTPETKNAISSLVKELKSLEKILENISKLNEKIGKRQSLSTPKEQVAAQRAARLAEIESRTQGRAQKDMAQLALQQERLAQAKIRTELAERKLAGAVQGTNSAYKAQKGYVDRLLKRTAVLFSLGAINKFMRSLREVTAEFELQRVSLASIIRDTQKANILFSQIKSFAVKSPFEIKDLVSYTKQLSAYRIETDELFETTKRLADVSAGLGVSMDRIILAYGQVKAASVLRAAEVRQFTEAGIPIIQLLAEKFSQLRGEVVSTGEVFDLISKRAVSFEMVKEVFEDMTDAGGIFYDMQERQAETLAGQWANLKDAYAIMLDEMGRDTKVRGTMEWMISTTKVLMENWRLVGDLILQAFFGAGILLGISKIKKFANSLKKGFITAALKQQTVAQLEYNKALAAEKALASTATEAERTLAAQRVETASATLATANASVAAAEATSAWSIAWMKLSAFMKANWILFVISAIHTLYSVISNAIEKANRLKNELKKIDEEGAVNFEKYVYGFEHLAEKAVEAADGSREQREALDELRRTYGEMIPVQDLNIQRLRELKGNYDALTQSIREYMNQKTLESKISAITEDYSKRIEKVKEELKDFLSVGKYVLDVDKFGNRVVKSIRAPFAIDKEQMMNVVRNVEKLSRDVSKSYKEIWVEALSEVINVGDDTEKWIEENIRSLSILPDVVREFDDEIKNVTDDMANATGYVGQYKKEYDALKESLKNITVRFQTPEGVDTFLTQQDKINQQVIKYSDLIRNAFAEANKELEKAGKPLLKVEESWFHLVNTIDETNPGDISAIKFNDMLNAVAMVHPQLYKLIQQIQKDYNKLVPEDETIAVLRRKMIDYAQSAFGSLDNVSRYFIASGTTIEKYAKEVKDNLEDVKKSIAEIALTEGLIGSGTGGGWFSPIDPKKKEQLNEQKQFLEYLTELLGQFEKTEKKSSQPTDDRLAKLKEEISLLEKVYTKYKEYSRYMSEEKAQEKINETFGKTLEIFKKYKINLPKTVEEYKAALKKMQDAMRKLPKSEKDVIELGFKIEDVDWNNFKEQLEKELDRLSKDISRTKTAKEFFEKMLNLTGNKELSADVTMTVYGDTGESLMEKTIEQLKKVFGNVDISDAVEESLGRIDFRKLREKLPLLPEEARKVAEPLVEAGEKANAEWLLDTYKVYEEFFSFEKRRTNVVDREAKKRREIEQKALMPDAQKELLINASKKLEAKELNDIDWEEFKASDDWVKTFEKIDKVSNTTIKRLLGKVREFIEANKDLTPEQLRTVMNEYEKLYEESIKRDPFKAIVDGIKGYKDALGELATARKNRDAAQNEVYAAQNEQRKAQSAYNTFVLTGDIDAQSKAYDRLTKANKRLADAQQNLNEKERDFDDACDDARRSVSKVKAGIEGVSQGLGSMQSFFSQIVDLIGDAKDSDFGMFLSEVAKWLGVVSSALAVVETMIVAIEASLTPVLAGLAAVAAIGALFSIRQRKKVKRANKEIERQQDLIDDLTYAYERLEKASEDLFGNEYFRNYENRQKNLQQQIVATEAQLQAERSKGKDADEDRIREYENRKRELQAELEDMQDELAEHFLGMDLGAAARSFAESWLDAYKEFGDTKKALEESMEDLIENLIIEAMAGQIAKAILDPVYEYINQLDKDAWTRKETYEHIFGALEKGLDEMDAGFGVMADYFEQVTDLRDKLGGDLTGISKDIATASEEDILGLAAGINTQNFYISHIDSTVSQILVLMQAGGAFASGTQMTDLITVQNQHLAYLPTIAQNTSEIVSRAERAAIACESIATNIDRVVKPNGVKGSYRVNTSLAN